LGINLKVMALTTQSGFKYLELLPTLWMGNLRKEEDVHFWKPTRWCANRWMQIRFYAQVEANRWRGLPVEFSIVRRL